MEIYENNADIINTNQIYIHDDILEKMIFDRIGRCLSLNITKFADSFKDEYKIEFINVIGFEMTSFAPWGESNRICDWEYIEYEKQSIVPKLLNQNSEYSHIDTQKQYIETKMLFVSGDTLIVACESIRFNHQ